ncbi:MAG: pyocin knob domain-containing protein, partial [Clostridium sp.]
GKENPIASVNGTNYNLYHVGNKPNAGDVGALATTGGAITGKLQIKGASSQLELIETDSADKTWRVEAQSNNLDFTESGVATRLRLHAGGGATVSGNLSVGGHTTIASGGILKLMSPNYSAGAQIYARDGGQYGAQLVMNAGGNLILGSGESGTAFVDLLPANTREDAYLLSDADAYIGVNCNVIADRKVHKFAADGSISFNDGSTTSRTFYGSSDTYVSRSGPSLYVAANAENGRVYIEGKLTPIVRVGTTDYTIYHSGNLPSFGDLATGKAIGAPQTLGASGTDLDDFKTAGVYVQPGNAGATAGLNYPEPLAGSLVVYQAAGIIQEYRIYNTSRMWRR